MAKKALLDVLEQTIGKYVKNLDAESLNVAVWSGKIELQSLELDVESVNAQLQQRAANAPNLALPFRVLSGRFESFQVDVPWAHITSRPVVLRARGLSVEVEPVDLSELRNVDTLHMDAAGEEDFVLLNKLKEAREHSLEMADQYRIQAYNMRKIALAEEEHDSGGKSNGTFTSRLVRRIIENIQIEIKDVHISLTDPDGSVGACLESLRLVTTDKHGEQVFVDRTQAPTRDSSSSIEMSFLYKMLQIEGLGLYLDKDEFVSARKSLQSITETNSNEEDDDIVRSDLPNDHSYILAPLSFEATLRQADSNVCIDHAKYHLRSYLSSLSILLNRSQLDFARKIMKVMTPTETGPKPLFPEYRPRVRVQKGTAKEWWKYAVRCIGRLNGRRSWVEFLIAFRKRKQYIPLFKRQAHHANCSWVKPLSSKEMDELVEIEHDRSITIEGLMAWRNIADAQIDKERQKFDEQRKSKESSSKKSYYSYLFGSSSTSQATPDRKTEGEIEEVAIELSEDEMRELEGIATVDLREKDLSKDSKLYDFEFVMRSFKIDLVAYDLKHVASLDMGQVTTSFDAAMDGAFAFDFELSNLEIFDRATPQSIFPSVLRMIDQPDRTEEKRAFQFNVSKSSTGDQSLSLKVATFEAVASQLMVKEVQRFFQASSNNFSSKKNRKANPLLAQSISGSVDLFYDALPGESFVVQQGELLKEETGRKPMVTQYDLSNALIDAWKEKTERKVSWMIDVDIHAPVVIIPEMCNDPRANVLVFDLGNLRLKYGKYRPSPQIQKWFNDNSRETLIEQSYDSGTLSINDLTFGVQKARLWQLRPSSKSQSSVRESAIIDPTGMSVDFAIETIGSEGKPRFCVLGVIPSISLTLSPSQSSRILPVLHCWKDVFGKSDDTKEMVAVVEDSSSESYVSVPEDAVSDEDIQSFSGNPPRTAGDDDSAQESYGIFYGNLGLQRLSVTLVEEGKKQLEAHLVSAYASILQHSDDSTVLGLRMGWFWVLDWMEHDVERRQRLVVHSNLPQPANFFAAANNYDILKELQNQGVFAEDYSGSTDLADISYKTLSEHPSKSEGNEDAINSSPERVLDAKFYALFMHWNPQAIKGINDLVGRFATAVDDDSFSDTGTLIMSPGKSYRNSKPTKSPRQKKERRQTRMLIRAEMESLNIILNSALDDLPLFRLTVAGTNVTITPCGLGLEMSLSLGDVRVSTQSDMGKTLEVYRTLLGLAPGRSESLLTVRYCSGYDAVRLLNLSSLKGENMEAVATIDLSPMRFCYIHSQIMTLVEYVTDGILGAIAAQAASSAAEAAIELANSVSGGSLFSIKAASLDLILPQAAYREEHFGINTSSLEVNFYMFNDQRGSHAEVTLSHVALSDETTAPLQHEPVQMTVDVKIPPYGVGDDDDQAMRVGLKISKASFIISKAQYGQILNTLDENVSEPELYLRDEHVTGVTLEAADGATKPGELTHAGAEFEERMRRLYMNISIKELALALHGRTSEDPIVQLRAVNASILMSQHPDLGKSSTMVSLQNLFCEDTREIALFRQYRYLVDQTQETEDAESKNIFQIEYISEKNKSKLDFSMGSPIVVLIPDVISELVSFVNIQRTKNEITESEDPNDQEIRHDTPLHQSVVQVDSIDGGETIETHLRSSNIHASCISAKTGTCRFVLVDLGSQLSADKEATRGSVTSSVVATSQLTETVVLQGIFSASWNTEADQDSGKMLSAEFQAHSDAMEIFTAFGRDMKSPLQILEPAVASAHGSLKSLGSGETEIEVRAAALTPMDFSLSMHNAALLSAIATSLGESFRYAEEKAASAEEQELTPKEQQRIEQLAKALERIGGGEETLAFQESGSSLCDSVVSSSHNISDAVLPSTTKYQIKVTMPQTSFTFINDLQGLDEALFRVSVTNFVAGCELISPKALFDFHCNTSILADYFDTSVNLWNRLLIKPWEITTKGSRGASRRFNSKRLSSTLDLESFPCCISFSEQFLVSLASAARMWSIYAAAKSGPVDQSSLKQGSANSSTMTASAARNLITSFPHAIANHSGMDLSFSLKGGSIEDQACPTGTTQYFRFDPPKGDGFGGRRAYGQDVLVQKLVEISVAGTMFTVNMDVDLALPPTAIPLENLCVLFTQVLKEGKTIVLHLSTHVEIVNNTMMPFEVDVVTNENSCPIGRCLPKNLHVEAAVPASVGSTSGINSKRTRSFSVPIQLLEDFYKSWESYGNGTVSLRLRPVIDPLDNTDSGSSSMLSGKVDLTASLLDLKRSPKGVVCTRTEVICRSHEKLGLGIHPFALLVYLKATLVAGEQVVMTASLQPRAVIQNKIPVALIVRTPMPQTYSLSKQDIVENKEVAYKLEPEDRIEVYTPGPSVAISLRPRDNPVAGNELGWMDEGWIDLPLVPEFSLQDPIISLLPLLKKGSSEPMPTNEIGAEIAVVEGKKSLETINESADSQNPGDADPKSPRSPDSPDLERKGSDDGSLAFFLTVRNYCVDHTGTLLVEQVVGNMNQSMRMMSSQWQSDKNLSEFALSSLHHSFMDEFDGFTGSESSRHLRHVAPQPLGAFSSPMQRRRLTLLPKPSSTIRLLQMTMDGEDGYRRTMPFMIEDLPIGDGGASTVPIIWENRTPSGLFAYRSLVNSHQSEIHIIPEFIIFNGSTNVILVKEKLMPELIVEAGETGQARAHARPDGFKLSFNFIDLECQTTALRVEKLGLKVAIVRAYNGTPIGSVYIQTVIDTHGDSRLVVKVSEVKFGSLGAPSLLKQQSFFGEDFCRFRVRWTELQLILNEVGEAGDLGLETWTLRKLRNQRKQSPRVASSKQNQRSESPSGQVRNAMFNLSPQNRANEYNEIQMIQQPIMAMVFSRFTVDFQRVFKEGEKKNKRDLIRNSPERSQISVIVHNVQIKDLTPDSLYPMVFDCTSDISFFDLCVRIRGPLNADLVKVDLFDLNLAHSSGRSEKMTLTTSEAYIWRILDLINRILAASGEVASFALKFEDDSEHGGYVIKIEDFAKSRSMGSEKYKYAAPKADTLYDVALTRVSPFTLVVSFRRSPETRRYSEVSKAPGAAITNYFTRKLKFTIDKAELNFARYEDRSLKGPSDRLIETLSTVYMGRMKFKVVSLLTAASLQDWRYLAARDTGDDEYIEGDILRATGNLAGKSAGTVIRVVGQGVGGAVAGVSSFVAEGIEGGASRIGARRLGSSVSSVVTGVGHGVGDTLTGVGTGAGKILQGAGQGVGHLFGGISGGALQIGKGIGKGITTGDTSAVIDGFSQGVSSVGGGITQGAESAVMGAADGILSAGKGIFSGVKSVGQGIGGAIRGKKPSHFERQNKPDSSSRSSNKKSGGSQK
ncbi:vacuolar sorting-associated protein 13, N-terminal domain containing protein [Nitzschia inconspicua]|uniref:Vacuolar sorting-associated protein 13, N-terminal domain containing protein n=1 Tax=Nitzschia inconspicua TaxID=303405 RepID=A0A9K3PY76_9STRA|nr:vacuolar sorting-associated protein 13, N-terminal domain containing protein [Nitzschia inconspicua]